MTREEAIQNIKKAIGFSDTIDESIFTLFPELKESESEDERIRKAIMGLTYIDGIEPILIKCSITAQDIRKHLEKQKAAETPQWMVDFLNDIRTASINKEGYDDYDGRREYEGKILAIIRWLEGNFIQQKEQKPVEFFDEYKIIKKHITEDMLSSEVNKRLTECGWYITDEKPVEWSEEDENNIGKLHRLLVICQSEKKFIPTSEYEKLDKWLKSLRPQPHWKPSEEQMRALSETIAFAPDTFKPKCTLMTLQNDLKKL